MALWICLQRAKEIDIDPWFLLRICIKPLSESIYACPSVRLSMLNCKQSTGRIYYPNWMKFGIGHLFGPRRNPIEIGKNRSTFRHSSHIRVPPNFRYFEVIEVLTEFAEIWYFEFLLGSKSPYQKL